ncbi:MAG: hypothetical protein QM756_39035 [Polyangiaceae bacterium]
MSIVSLSRYALALSIGFSSSLLCVNVAHAGDKALAESLFDAGRQLMQAGNFEQACPKFAESQRQDPSAGTLINLAKCYEGLGRTASAWAEYKEAATLARTMGRDNQALFADEGAKRLESSLSKLRIEAPTPPIAGLSVMRDGVELGSGSLGVALAVDPGEHVVEARAPGYKPFSTRVSVKPQGDQQMLQLPVLERDAAPVAAPAVVPATPTTTAAPAAPAPASSGSNKTLAYVLGGVGVAGLVVGTAFGLAAKSQASAAQDDPTLCPAKLCSPQGRKEIDAAERKATIATVGFGVGIVGIGAGVYFLLSGNKQQEAPPEVARLTPWFAPNASGVSYSGAF